MARKAAHSGVDRSTMDFRQTLVQSGENKALNARSSDFWKAGNLPEYQPNWQAPPLPALLLQSQNAPSDWRGSDFMATMTNIYQTSSQNAIHYLQKSGILTLPDDKEENNNNQVSSSVKGK